MPPSPAPAALGLKPDFLWIPLDSLVVDPRYQRKINDHGMTLVRRIAREFSWLRMAPLIVSKPDKIGDYAIIDGQHRFEAALLHLEVDMLPCWVVPATDVAAQAESFIAVNKARTGMTRINVFWAEVARGRDRSMAVKRVCDDAGVAISRVGTGRQKPLHTIAVAAIDRCLSISPPALECALRVLADSQRDAENAFRAPTILALTRLIGGGQDVDRDRLVRVLSDMDLDDVIADARSLKKITGIKVEDGVQKLISRSYNKGLCKNRIPEPGQG